MKRTGKYMYRINILCLSLILRSLKHIIYQETIISAAQRNLVFQIVFLSFHIINIKCKSNEIVVVHFYIYYDSEF